MHSDGGRERSGRLFVIDCHRQARFYESWIDRCGYPVEMMHDVPPDWRPPTDAAIVISAETYDEPSVSALRSAVEHQVPVLVLADGILEFRNTWQNPTQVAGNIYQPVLGHKLACVGASQRRHVEAWGNPGVCEIVGLPALDGHRRHPRAPGDGSFRLLVASSRHPYFDDRQRAIVIEQFVAVRDAIAAFADRSSRRVAVTWRLTGELGEALGVQSALQPVASVSALEALCAADALVTMPSTLMLEAMLLDLPVAQVDFMNLPQYVQTGWSASAPPHLPPVLEQLVDPPAERLAFQRVALHDALQCRVPAADRLVDLVRAMCRIGQECRTRAAPLAFPPTLLDRGSDGALEPKAPTSPPPERDAAALELEVRHLRKALSRDLGAVAQRHRALDAYKAQLDAFKAQLDGYDGHLQGLAARAEATKSAVSGMLHAMITAVVGNRPLFVWGTGTFARRACEEWPFLIERTAGFVDSNPARHAGRFLGLPVLGPGDFPDGAFVLIASSASAEIATTLGAAGRQAGADFAVLPEPPGR